MPSHIILTCGGPPIISVEYAAYGIPKGKCSDGGFGSGSSFTFEDATRVRDWTICLPAVAYIDIDVYSAGARPPREVQVTSPNFGCFSQPGPDADHPTCDCVNVKAKITQLCVGKPTCEVDASGANTLFGKDPCYQTGKWVAIVVECPSDWGFLFIIVLFVCTLIYAGAGIGYAHKVNGEPLGLNGLPHQPFWGAVRSLVADGVAYMYTKARVGDTAGGYSKLSKKASGSADDTHPEGTKAVRKKSAAGKSTSPPAGKPPSAGVAVPQPFANDGLESGSGSEDDSLVG